MRAIRLASAGSGAALLLLGSSSVVLGQEDVADEGPHYFYGQFEGYLHPDEGNPLGCDIGMTSDNTLYGESTLLGATTITWTNCYVPPDTLHNVQLADFTFTGESGDTMTGTATGDCIPDMVTEPGGIFSCWIDITITGGTGSLEGASGEIHGIGYTTNVQSDHPEAAPGDIESSSQLEGLVEY